MKSDYFFPHSAQVSQGNFRDFVVCYEVKEMLGNVVETEARDGTSASYISENFASFDREITKTLRSVICRINWSPWYSPVI